MDTPLQYLLDFLVDEFKHYPEVRIRKVPYIKEEGVSVKTETREYFFPRAWIEYKNLEKINQLVLKIKTVLPERGSTD